MKKETIFILNTRKLIKKVSQNYPGVKGIVQVIYIFLME